MMTNLFSTFDPCTGNLSLNWISSLILLLMFNYNYWIKSNNVMNLMLKIMMSMKNELNVIMPQSGSSIMFLGMSIFILINNIMGLIPYIFTSSSHLTFSLALALPMWVAFMMYGWMNKTNTMFTHLVPMGTPSILMPFMVLIETISNLIRPGSLAVRLTSNMIAGHLLMALLGNSCSFITTMVFMLIFMMLMLFETAVSFIQSYVFMILATLYSSEV
uniref:ATP synthase subunit a n=2 Tax=Membracidae TaxID=30095 RepID=A0A5B9T3G3_9HEMI|nr:ATP synthase F0 subunit 6 [Maurya qinlingensis]YP_010963540.1 ATP synthase F0 subunit 6 [Antialcidas trifoliaceus]QEG98448.1 ATP synthase F0 subunit 6 [Maurya qinlingensis]WKZ08023.1 ATP synthase F0 subunit 6 [Antialcidas trifoliaceus]